MTWILQLPDCPEFEEYFLCWLDEETKISEKKFSALDEQDARMLLDALRLYSSFQQCKIELPNPAIPWDGSKHEPWRKQFNLSKFVKEDEEIPEVKVRKKP